MTCSMVSHPNTEEKREKWEHFGSGSYFRHSGLRDYSYSTVKLESRNATLICKIRKIGAPGPDGVTRAKAIRTCAEDASEAEHVCPNTGKVSRKWYDGQPT
jgi:hypothetical protein